MRNIFGPSQTEAFQQIAKSLNADYHEVNARSKSARGRIDLTFSPWIITIDISESDNVDGRTFYTRLRAPYVQAIKEAFNFELYRGDIFTKIGKLFGMQDIEIGDDRFDKDFVIQGNIPDKVQEFMQNKDMRHIISEQAHFHFKIDEKGEKDNKALPEGIGLLSFKIGGVVTEEEEIKQFVALMKVALRQVVEIGLAKDENPDFLI